MSGSSVVYMEIGFNILYLICIYVVISVMLYRLGRSSNIERGIANTFLWAYILLAVGDTGHVGFRVIAFLSGGVESNSLLVGIGALATSVTVTGYYLLMLEMWHRRFTKKRGGWYWFLFSMGVVRLITMTLPGNQWGNVYPPQTFSIIRNIFLVVLGVGVAVNLLIYGKRENVTCFRPMSYAIFVSFAFYIPVILFIRDVPMLGMLMIPKTVAYLVIAFLGLKHLFPTNRVPAANAA